MIALRSTTALSRLKRFGRDAVRLRCELCGRELADRHEHLLRVADQLLSCACGACATLFDAAPDQPYLRVPRIVEALTLALTDSEWQQLGIPVQVACLVPRRAPDSRTATDAKAFYPGPAGVTQSELPGEASAQPLVARHSLLSRIAADTEALLVDRTARPALHFRVSVDVCFEFAGSFRSHTAGSPVGAVRDFVARLALEAGARGTPTS